MNSLSPSVLTTSQSEISEKPLLTRAQWRHLEQHLDRRIQFLELWAYDQAAAWRYLDCCMGAAPQLPPSQIIHHSRPYRSSKRVQAIRDNAARFETALLRRIEAGESLAMAQIAKEAGVDPSWLNMDDGTHTEGFRIKRGLRKLLEAARAERARKVAA